MDEVMTKAPLGQEQTGPNPTDPRQTGSEGQPVSRRPWRPSWRGSRWS
jgi:hypothetical protein